MNLFNKCCCCFCLSEKTSAIVCTYIMIVILSIGAGINYFQSDSKMDFLLNVVLIVSLIFLIKGINKKKKSYLNQFDVLYGIFVFCGMIGVVFFDFFNVMVLINIHDEVVIHDYRLNNEGGAFMSESEIIEAVKKNTSIALIAVNTSYLILAYYYFTTRHYVREIISEIDIESNARKEESGC